MIDAQGYLRCNGCGKKLGFNLEGQVEVICPRCKMPNVFSTKYVYKSHKLVTLKNESVV